MPRTPPCAGTPLVLVNQLVGALMAYGLAGLRNDPRAIFAWIGIVSLQCLISNQFLITCVWLTKTAVSPPRPSAWRETCLECRAHTHCPPPPPGQDKRHCPVLRQASQRACGARQLLSLGACL